MSLSLIEREKLLNTVQRTFPLAKDWLEIRNTHKGMCNSKKDYVMLLTAIIFGLAPLCVGAMSLMNHLSSSKSFILSVVGFFSLVVSVASGLGLLTAGVWGISSLLNSYKMIRMKKDSQNYKEKIRDYIAEKTCLREVQKMLSKLSNEDLNLLSKHPNLNSVFKPIFQEESTRRENLVTLDKINSDFLSPMLAIEKDAPRPTETAGSFTKMNI